MDIPRTNFQRYVTLGAHWLAQLASLALGVMIVVTCLDVVLRLFKVSLTGAYDIVCICAAIAISCALPATTAAKGHVTIEYFFHKLNRVGRRVADTIVHGGLVTAFAVAVWQCLRAGQIFLEKGQVTATLQIPMFWVLWVMALGFLFSALASLAHLLNVFQSFSRPVAQSSGAARLND